MLLTTDQIVNAFPQYQNQVAIQMDQLTQKMNQLAQQVEQNLP